MASCGKKGAVLRRPWTFLFCRPRVYKIVAKNITVPVIAALKTAKRAPDRPEPTAAHGRVAALFEECHLLSQEDVLHGVLSRISDKVAETVKDAVTETLQRELSSAMASAMGEAEFYRQISEKMRNGLQDIFKEIVNVSTDACAKTGASRAQALCRDASKQIDAIMQTTLEATEKIMEASERLLEQQKEAGAILARLNGYPESEKELNRLCELNISLETALTDIITDLSFHDLTGQRLKKVVATIGSIRETVFDLYVSTGLMLKTREETPEKDLSEIAAESDRKTAEIRNSNLQGPARDASQKDVDELLASLGL